MHMSTPWGIQRNSRQNNIPGRSQWSIEGAKKEKEKEEENKCGPGALCGKLKVFVCVNYRSMRSI